MSETKKVLITSALPYVNNVPHLGNLVGAVLSADVFARYMRSAGRETLFICGSDEHGTATETKAKQEGVTPQELCDKFHDLHKQIYDWFDIAFDIFGRTSEQNHHKIAQDIFRDVVKHGYVEEKTITQPYSAESEMFLADRFIEGTCPHCGYEDARGDQCDNCQKLLTPQELVHPRSAIDGSVPEFKETNHLFLRLDALQPALEKWVDTQQTKGKWTENAKRVTKAWFKEGLRSRAITRDLKWGIPVPEDLFEGHYKDKVFYVWFDAPIGYISLTEQLLGDAYKKWWKQPEDVELYQFMGKDNIPFHSIIFPGTLLATQEVDAKQPTTTFTTAHHINATEYLNYEHGKFSKSRGVGVFGDQVQKSGIASDIWRYTLIFYRPENADTQFTWKGLQERLNNELVANFGNFVHRTLTFTKRFFEGNIEALTEDDLTEEQKEFYSQWKEQIAQYHRLFSEVKLRDALAQFMKMSSMCNQYFQEAQPWKTRTEAPERAQKDIAFLNFLVKELAILCEPFMPATSKAIFTQLNHAPEDLSTIGSFTLGKTSIGEPAVLFEKLDDAQFAQAKKKTVPLEEKALKESKNKETKKKASSSQKKKEVASVVSLEPEDVDLRVGKITEIIKHPKADKLFIEQVDMGDKTLQIVSGLVDHYTAEELLGKHIVVVTNLKAAKLRGELSQGMVLAAEDAEGTVGLVFAPQAKPGERVRTVRQGTAKDEISFEEFMTLSFDLVAGEVLLNKEKLAAKQSNLIVDKDLKNGSVR
jgi:methionyl-tRNA synthetase